MAEITIREAHAADAEPLRSVIDAAYAPYAQAGLELPPVSEGLADDIRDHLVFVAEGDGALLGGIVLVPGASHLGIANLAVAPAAAGRGIGQRLMAWAEDAARDRELSRLTLTTHAAMAGTQAFYARLGWQETGRDGNRVFMEKGLSLPPRT